MFTVGRFRRSKAVVQLLSIGKKLENGLVGIKRSEDFMVLKREFIPANLDFPRI